MPRVRGVHQLQLSHLKKIKNQNLEGAKETPEQWGLLGSTDTHFIFIYHVKCQSEAA